MAAAAVAIPVFTSQAVLPAIGGRPTEWNPSPPAFLALHTVHDGRGLANFPATGPTNVARHVAPAPAGSETIAASPTRIAQADQADQAGTPNLGAGTASRAGASPDTDDAEGTRGSPDDERGGSGWSRDRDKDSGDRANGSVEAGREDDDRDRASRERHDDDDEPEDAEPSEPPTDEP